MVSTRTRSGRHRRGRMRLMRDVHSRFKFVVRRLACRFSATSESPAEPYQGSGVVEELRSVASLLDTKAPQEAMAFKRWLREVAQKAAEAANEGGFLGFGGVAVSDAEK